MSSQDKKIEEIYYAALDRKSRAERSAYLDGVCGENKAIRSRVDSLLEAHFRAVGFLEVPILDEQATLNNSALTEGPGTVIGRYKLLEKIGEGGMAVVYMAEQQEPIRRKVALKIIKLGMDTRSVIARFEAERQALAMMDHPNIARVVDAGATETGRLYFAMELVTGVSITEYCDKKNLSTKERLALFIQVCNAVHHAHQKGIIHRDIKPSNVMVTQHEGAPVPKVIDFGIAKATNQRLTEKTLFTRYAHIIGTPAYMSPEQADMSDLDVDTRSDIYSLGVLLYELLTGATPFSEEELRKAGYIEMQRVIREQEPPKPSTKLSTLGNALAHIAELRSAKPEQLSRLIRGDLDWIVMKSLEKDRTRRYETANAFATDIQRHMEDEPILARSPSIMYQLRKFLRRHRLQVAAMVMMAVLMFAVTAAIQSESEKRLRLADAESFILARARQSFAARDFPDALKDVKSLLNSKHIGPEAQLLYASILVERQEPNEAEAVVVLESLLGERPEIAGTAHALLARIYWEGELGGPQRRAKVDYHKMKAEELLPEKAEAFYLRALTAATIKDAVDYLNRALDISQDHYESRRIRASILYCSREFSRAAEDALCLTLMSPKDSAGYLLRGNALRELGRLEEAVDIFSKAIGLPSAGDAQLVDLYDRRREAYTQMSKYQEALADAQKCVSLSGSQEVHRVHAFCALVSLGRYEEAKAECRQLYASIPGENTEFWRWCAKYVVDTLESGRELEIPALPEPAFVPMLEAKELYLNLKSKGRRVITDGFNANWSPDGTKLAYSKGVHGVSGVVVYDIESQQSELLAVPGKDPLYSPDGQYIAFIRDRQVLPLDRLATDEQRDDQPFEQEEIWIMHSDGAKPRRIARGKWPHWSLDSQRLFYTTVPDSNVCSVTIAEADAPPLVVYSMSGSLPRPVPLLSRDGNLVAYMTGTTLDVFDLSRQTTVAQWVTPWPMEVRGWAPNGPQLCTNYWIPGIIGASMWVYDLEQDYVTKVLTAYRTRTVSWSRDEKQLAAAMEAPFYDIWILDAESLGRGQTLDEHYQEQLALYTRRIEADPEDAQSYHNRARYYHYLNNKEQFLADMDAYIAMLNVSGGGNQHNSELPQLLSRFWQGAATNIPGSSWYTAPSVSTDGRSLYSDAQRADGHGGYDIWVSTRETIHDDWPEPVNAGPPVNTSFHEGNPDISADGLTLFFASDRPKGYGDADIWLTTRAPTGELWSEPVNLGPTINSPYYDSHPSVSTDGLSLFFCSTRPGGHGDRDIWLSTRTTTHDSWSEPRNLGPIVNSPRSDSGPDISSDGLKLFFDSARPGRYGGRDTWVTTRATTEDDWGVPVNLGPVVNTSYRDITPCISEDGLILYLGSGWLMRQVSIAPVPAYFRDDRDSDSAPESVTSNGGKEG